MRDRDAPRDLLDGGLARRLRRRAGGRFDWTDLDDEVFDFWIEEARTVGVHLLGRKLYETMLYWEPGEHDGEFTPAEREWADLWCALPKVVFSTSLAAVRGNARLATGGVAAAGLIDEYRVNLFPVLVGGGLPYFPRAERRVDLRLVGTRTFTSGVVHLRHRVVC